MDQVKMILGVMKKNAFWILICVVVLVGLGVWFTVSAALAKQYEERKTTLNDKYTTVSGIKSEATGEEASHPNEEKIDRWLARVDRNRVEATAAWEEMYRDQKERNQWPSTLSKDFHRMITKIGLDEDIPNFFLIEYQNFIKTHFPFIDEIIDRRKPKEVEGGRRGPMAGMTGMGSDYMEMGSGMGSDMGSGMGSGMDDYGSSDYSMMDGTGGRVPPGTEMEGIVEWDNADYGRVQQGVFWKTRPLTIEVRLAQEDLWVYEALLRSIAKTNEDAGATSYYNAAIKRIVALEIGQPAAAAMKSAKSRLGLDRLLGGASGGMGMGSDMMGSDMMYESDMMGSGMDSDMGYESGMMDGSGSMMGGATARDPEMVKTRLLTGRYVDLTGEPQAADSEPYAEFKLMPVHIVVIMDQQKLPDFLVNLANCEMPVDVKQVSIQASGNMNFTTGGRGGMGGYGSDGGMMDSYGSGGMDSYGSGGMGGSSMGMGGEEAYGDSSGSMGDYGGGAGATTASDEAKQDVPIEILGVIRIFNPPDKEKLGTGEEAIAAAPPADAPTMMQVPAGASQGPQPGGEAPASGAGDAPGAGPGAAPGTGSAPAATGPTSGPAAPPAG